jgi:HK97 family phage major capsid protein
MDPFARVTRRTSPLPTLVIALAFALAAIALAMVTGAHLFTGLGPLALLLGVVEIPDLKELRSKQDLTDLQKQVRDRIQEMHESHGVEPFNDAERSEFDTLKGTDEELTRRVTEYDRRVAYLERIAEKSPEQLERDDDKLFRDSDAHRSVKERDIYDLSTIRSDFANPERTRQQLHDRARRAVETMKFPITADQDNVRVYGGWTNDRAKAHVEHLLEKSIDEGDEEGSFARYVLATSDPTYKRAFTKIMRASARGVAPMDLSREEQASFQRVMAAERAIGLGTTGVPLPFTLDATVIPTSNSVVNPWRAICRTEQVTTNNWKGVTSGAITAAYAAAATEASDNTPTMAQPSVDAVRAQAFVPFDIEVDQDWAAVQSSIGVLFADAKDDLESNKFFSGGGTNEPFGLNAMTSATDVAVAGGSGAFAIADAYKLEENVVPRARPRSTIVGNRTILNKIRQFDTAGGAGLWLYFPQGLANKPASDRGDGNTGAAGLGYPVYESSQMLAVLTTGSRILLMGNFKYYLIVDRVGMSVEVIQHLFGAANRFPTGQRGLYAMWRNGGKVLSESQFKFLKTS